MCLKQEELEPVAADVEIARSSGSERATRRLYEAIPPPFFGPQESLGNSVARAYPGHVPAALIVFPFQQSASS
jgi:hypothetical protein